MITTEHFGYFDNAGTWREVIQVWARIPATGMSVIVSVQDVAVDPARAPARPTRPA